MIQELEKDGEMVDEDEQQKKEDVLQEKQAKWMEETDIYHRFQFWIKTDFEKIREYQTPASLKQNI